MMENDTKKLDFLLGALSPAGFHGYFPALANEGDIQMYLIKSGPGCGKSTLMRGLEERAGGTVERIHCSSDPDRLDGVVFWQQNAAIVDATAPHTLDPQFPVAYEQVVSLYHTLDAAMLRQNRAEIKRLFLRCKGLQERAARYIASAGGLLLDSRRTAAYGTDLEKARRYAARLGAKYLPKRAGRGREQIRLLSAVTPKGIIAYRNTIQALASQIIVLHDEYGAASRLIMDSLRSQALARGHRVITCWCAMAPEDKIDHLLLPELGLAFLTSNSWHPMDLPGQKNVRCTRFENPDTLRCRKKRLRFNRKAAAELLAQASAMQRDAKASHDELEAYYQAAADFSQVDTVRSELAAQLGLG